LNLVCEGSSPSTSTKKNIIISSIEAFEILPTKRKLVYYKKYRSVSYDTCHDLIRAFCFDELCEYVSNMKKKY
jgi:hypothetical protein